MSASKIIEVEEAVLPIVFLNLFRKSVWYVVVTMCLQLQRLGPLPSSFASLDVLLGTDEQLGFEDTLNRKF